MSLFINHHSECPAAIDVLNTCFGDDRCELLVPRNAGGAGWTNPDIEVIEPTTGKDEYTPVNHPLHYNVHPNGIECIDVVEGFNFNVGNAIKYLWRAGLKSDDAVKDLEKAAWYVQRELERAKTKLDSIPYSEYRAKRLVEIDTTDTVTDKGDYSGEDVTETVWPATVLAPTVLSIPMAQENGQNHPHALCRAHDAHPWHVWEGKYCIGRAYDIT